MIGLVSVESVNYFTVNLITQSEPLTISHLSYLKLIINVTTLFYPESRMTIIFSGSFVDT